MMEQLLAKKKKKQQSAAAPSADTTTSPRYSARSDPATTRRSSESGADATYHIPAPSPNDRAVQIGPGVEFEGTIQNCDELIIEGTVKATITATRMLVLEGGCFTGAAMVGEAKVQGQFDGALTASSKLTVETTGHVSGEIRYAELEISSGGVLTGDIGEYAPDAKNTGAYPPDNMESKPGITAPLRDDIKNTPQIPKDSADS
ncbi:MAG: polymer-forming cytoskeletal protein [Alphaproteobacteria bacterium]|nr:polymer-forming cytoskeletal protein [Alphaproteobacteria bacterium]